MNKLLNMKTAQRGFTLIELIITIVIIGVLAAVAIPQFQNLSSDAEKGVAAGVSAALASATSVNYARSKVPGAGLCASTDPLGTGGCTYYALTTCGALDTVKAFLADIPTGYTVGAAAAALNTTGTSATCTITKGTATATFSAYGA